MSFITLYYAKYAMLLLYYHFKNDSYYLGINYGLGVNHDYRSAYRD